MRRKDREVADKSEIYDILQRCGTVRIAMHGPEYPYIVPVSFGAERVEDQVIVYFHCAQEGMKIDLLGKDPRVCVEGEIFVKTEETQHGITARYESVIGFGQCTFVSRLEEKLHGLKVLTAHYGYPDDPVDRCAGLEHLLVGKITLEEIYGKRNR